MITSLWKKIGIQFCDGMGIQVNIEDATAIVEWNTADDSIISNRTFKPPHYIITEVRSDVSGGFSDRVEVTS